MTDETVPIEGDAEYEKFRKYFSFLPSTPLPVHEKRNSKIYSRSFNPPIYFPSYPNREEVRKDNYSRRQDQALSQGFYAPIVKPYKEIGGPLVLDDRQLTLLTLTETALGLTNSTSFADQSTHRKKDTEKAKPEFRKAAENNDSHYFIKPRGRIMNVKQEAKAIQIMSRYASNGLPLQNLVTRLVDFRSDVDKKVDKKNKKTKDSNESEESSSDQESLHGESEAERTNQEDLSRPYSAYHYRIGYQTPNMSAGEHLYRQLCALCWLLDAIANTDPAMTVCPIMQSWSLQGLISMKVNAAEVKQRTKTIESNWSSLTKSQNLPIPVHSNGLATTVKRNISRMPSIKPGTKPIDSARKGNSGIGSSIILSTDELSESVNLVEGIGQQTIMETSIAVSTLENENGPAQYHYQENNNNENLGGRNYSDLAYLSKESQPKKPKTPGMTRPATAKAINYRRLLRDREYLTAKLIEVEKDLEKEESYHAYRKSGDPSKNSASVGSAANDHISVKISEELLQFANRAVSAKYQLLADRSQKRFKATGEEQAFIISDQLHQMDIRREELFNLKFKSLQFSSGGFRGGVRSASSTPRRQVAETFDRATRRLRAKTAAAERQRRLAIEHETEQRQRDWLGPLKSCLPPSMFKDWRCIKILERLDRHISFRPNQTTDLSRFWETLKTLKAHEICDPDVAAAVEFCRERILRIPDAMFEQELQSIFPDIERPSPSERLKSAKPAEDTDSLLSENFKD